MSNTNFRDAEFMLKRLGYTDVGDYIVSALYVSKFNPDNKFDSDNEDDFYYNYFCDKRLYDVAKSYVYRLDENCSRCLLDLCKDCDTIELLKEVYASYQREKYNYMQVDIQLNQLLYRLLDVKETDIILDLCSGKGSFLFNACLNGSKKVIGIEKSQDFAYISQMVLALVKAEYSIIAEDALYEEIPKFDKAAVVPPFGMNYDIDITFKYWSPFKEGLTNRTRLEWYFVDRLLSSLPDSGRVVAVLPSVCLFSTSDKSYRSFLLKKNLVEGVIKLPSCVIPFMNSGLSIVVFSKNNQSVKILDASSLGESKNRQLYLQIDEIVDKYNQAETKSISDIIELCDLSVDKLLFEKKELKYPQVLGNIAQVFQGSQYTISHFNDKISIKPTDTRLLTSSDIEDGIISWDKLTYIENTDAKLLKFRLQKNDVVITSKSSKVKIAVVDDEPKENVVLTGGMICIRPNVSVVDPIFLKMFLESTDGQAILKSIQRGSIIQTITVYDLSSITISCPPIDTQEDFARKYRKKLGTYNALKKELETIENQIKNCFDEMLEEI